MTPQSLAHVNGEIVPINEAKISLLDWVFCILMPPMTGHMFGMGIFFA